MRLRVEQLKAHLAKGLAPVYVVAGDEPLLVAQSCDLIRKRARQGGLSERVVYTVEGGFDWSVLAGSAAARSLFAERRLVELRLPSGKPGDAGSKALQGWVANDETLLLLVTGKLDAAAQRSKWLQALESSGILIQVWPLERAALPGWIRGRMRDIGMPPNPEVVALLAERGEGNLLACAQEIDKLYLLYGRSAIDVEQVTAAIADCARFDIFGLADAALAGDAQRAIRVFDSLGAEGTEPSLVLWALSRELRLLARIAVECEGGAAMDSVFQRERVRDRHKPVLRTALGRGGSAFWRHNLVRAAGVDRVIKGVDPGNAWEDLLELILAIAGRPTVGALNIAV